VPAAQPSEPIYDVRVSVHNGDNHPRTQLLPAEGDTTLSGYQTSQDTPIPFAVNVELSRIQRRFAEDLFVFQEFTHSVTVGMELFGDLAGIHAGSVSILDCGFLTEEWASANLRPKYNTPRNKVSPNGGWIYCKPGRQRVQGAAGFVGRDHLFAAEFHSLRAYSHRNIITRNGLGVCVCVCECVDLQCFAVGKKAAGRLLDGRQWNEYPRRDDHA
jgi:hypothetical protein